MAKATNHELSLCILFNRLMGHPEVTRLVWKKDPVIMELREEFDRLVGNKAATEASQVIDDLLMAQDIQHRKVCVGVGGGIYTLLDYDLKIEIDGRDLTIHKQAKGSKVWAVCFQCSTEEPMQAVEYLRNTWFTRANRQAANSTQGWAWKVKQALLTRL